MDTILQEIDEIVNEPIVHGNVNLDEIQDLFTAEQVESELPPLEKIYLYHIYNIHPSHMKTFVQMYDENITGYVYHPATPNTSKEELTLHTSGVVVVRSNKIAEVLTCTSSSHFHVVLKLSRPKSDYMASGGPETKWFGFQTYKDGTFVQQDGSYLSRQQSWRKMFPTQEPYKTSSINSEQQYINLTRYLQSRLDQYGRGNITNLKTYTPDKYLYSGLDKRKSNTVSIESVPDTDSTSSISSIVQSKKEILQEKQRIHEETVQVDYKLYEEYFLSKGYQTIAEWQQGNATTASKEIKDIFIRGKQAEKDIRAKPLSFEEKQILTEQFPLMTKLIKLVLFHITLKRVEKDIFLILQGPPSCGKSSISVSLADAYPNSYGCISMEAFLHRDNLGMESVATRHCESIICDEFGFVDREGRGHKQVQDQLKQYLSGKEIMIRVRKNTKEVLNDIARIKLIIASINVDKKRLHDVNMFLEDTAVKERTITIRYNDSFLKKFQVCKIPTNQIPYTELSRYAIATRIELETLTQKVDTAKLERLNTFIADCWDLHSDITVSYNSMHSYAIISRLNESFGLVIPENITSLILEPVTIVDDSIA